MPLQLHRKIVGNEVGFKYKMVLFRFFVIDSTD